MAANPRSLYVCAQHGGAHYLSQACKDIASGDTAANRWSVILLGLGWALHDVPTPPHTGESSLIYWLVPP